MSFIPRPLPIRALHVTLIMLSFLWISSAVAFAAAPSGTDSTGAKGADEIAPSTHPAEKELIVLLAPGAYGLAPADLVQLIEKPGALSAALPGALSWAKPDAARLAVPGQKYSADLAAQDPSDLRQRLARYVVLTLPEGTDLEAARSVLVTDPQIEYAELNQTLSFSVIPSDPLLPMTSIPEQHQWGAHLMNLPAAWDRMRGQAYLGLIDTGLDPTHPDLRPFPAYSSKGECGYAPGTFEGGNFRPHLSWDVGDDDCDVTEDHEYVGHGTHVAGIAAATTDNALGGAGHCWDCPLMMAKASTSPGPNLILSYEAIANSLIFLVDHGVQSVSMSFGGAGSCQGNIPGIMCTALQLAANHDVVLMGSSGNNKQDINFPASDPRVLAIGGVQPGGALWDEQTIDTFLCPCDRGLLHPALCSQLPTAECGSNYTMTPGSAEQTLVVPARTVVSTFVPGGQWNPDLGCTDADLLPAGDGFGPCTGTSMSSPAASALAGLVRSVNPLLDRDEVATVLTSTASLAGSGDPHMGNGIPDAAAAVDLAFGTAAGQAIANRTTPLFSVYSSDAEAHLFTTVPQQIQAAFFDDEVDDFVSTGSGLTFYAAYPQIPQCTIGPCPPRSPRASVAILTSHVDPGTGLGSPKPLYRLSYDQPFGGNAQNRSFAYATSQAEIGSFAAAGYRLDGLEGYLLPRCSPEPSCQPNGTTTLHRLYNASRDDYVIVPAAQVASFIGQGYGPLAGFPEILGYAFTLQDTDGDHLLDGFESLIGTDPLDFDTDCDGLSDGAELPPAGIPAGDPLDGTCPADLAATVSASTGFGGLWNVTIGASNLGPNAASSTVIEVLFTSTHWDWFMPQVPFGCTYVEPPKGTIFIGTHAEFRCVAGTLGAGLATTRTFGVQPSQHPSILDITVTVSSSTPDNVPANNQATAQVTGGMLQ